MMHIHNLDMAEQDIDELVRSHRDVGPPVPRTYKPCSVGANCRRCRRCFTFDSQGQFHQRSFTYNQEN